MTLAHQALALHGGEPTITEPLAPYRSLGLEEEEAVLAVVRSGVLSAFVGAPGDGFLGGPMVREFEEVWAKHFGVKHAVTVNSWTSGLIAAVSALGLEPGDEVITSPWTMSATAAAILHSNAIPVFADIEPEYFCLDPVAVEASITARTKAIIAVDIFGQSADLPALREIASRRGLRLLTDTAQAPGSRQDGQFTGTLADIGGYSLNYHKHIHTGEGGVLVTNDDALAIRLRLIRNHGENAVSAYGLDDIAGLVGFNFRLGEIEAAIGIQQLRKLPQLVESRQTAVTRLRSGLEQLGGLHLPKVRPGGTHVYYVFGMTLDPAIGVPRALLVRALEAEGVPALAAGYTCLHRTPVFTRRQAYGHGGFPWTLQSPGTETSYKDGICPVAETLHDETFLGMEMCAHEYSSHDIDLIVAAFRKVWSHRGDLLSHA
jgi:dTDP-4-amino-4,6-dideoxygalactose transaminase